MDTGILFFCNVDKITVVRNSGIVDKNINCVAKLCDRGFYKFLQSS